MKILVVCLGNICRSPMGEAALRAGLVEAGLADRVEVESAGTGSWNLGAPPNPRMAQAASVVGITLQGCARQVVAEDLSEADLVLAMDRQNLRDLRALVPHAPEILARIHLLRDFSTDGRGTDVPDPYEGGDEDFTEVVEIVGRAIPGVIAHVRERLG